MPPKLQARTLRLLELVETHGANPGPPHTQQKTQYRVAKNETGSKP